jgi:hypothetical protein
MYISYIGQSYTQIIYQHKFHWEKYDTAWFGQDLSPRIYIRRIYPGHWAWSDELEQQGSNKYESSNESALFIQ